MSEAASQGSANQQLMHRIASTVLVVQLLILAGWGLAYLQLREAMADERMRLETMVVLAASRDLQPGEVLVAADFEPRELEVDYVPEPIFLVDEAPVGRVVADTWIAEGELVRQERLK